MFAEPTESGYQPSKGARLLAAAAAGSAGAAALVTLYTAFAVESFSYAILSICAVAASIISIRLARMRIDVLDGGVRVANPLRTTFVPWSDFEGFVRARFLFVYPRVVTVKRVSGHPIPIVLLIAHGPFIGGDDSRVDAALDDLNRQVQHSRHV